VSLSSNFKLTTVCTAPVPWAAAPVTPVVGDEMLEEIAEDATPRALAFMLPTDSPSVWPWFAPIWKDLFAYEPSNRFIELNCVVLAIRSISADSWETSACK